jgi:hypothetical protein
MVGLLGGCNTDINLKEAGDERLPPVLRDFDLVLERGFYCGDHFG